MCAFKSWEKQSISRRRELAINLPDRNRDVVLINPDLELEDIILRLGKIYYQLDAMNILGYPLATRPIKYCITNISHNGKVFPEKVSAMLFREHLALQKSGATRVPFTELFEGDLYDLSSK